MTEGIRQSLVTLLLVLVLLGAGTTAWAATPAPWAPQLVGCTDPRADVLHDALLVELRPLLQKSTGAPVRLQVRCGGERITIELQRGGVTRRVLMRAELPARGRARFIALVAAELLTEALRATPSSHPASRPASQPQSQPASLPRQPPPETEASRKHFRLGGAALVGAIGGPKRLLVGGALAFGHRVHPNFGWRADLQLGRAERPVSLGTIGLLWLSASLSALVHLQSGPWGIALGPGVRLGAVRFAGEGTTGVKENSFFALHLGAIGVVELAFELRADLALTVGFEGGYTLRPVEARQEDVAGWAVEGASVSGTAGIFFLF